MVRNKKQIEVYISFFVTLTQKFHSFQLVHLRIYHFVAHVFLRLDEILEDREFLAVTAEYKKYKKTFAKIFIHSYGFLSQKL